MSKTSKRRWLVAIGLLCLVIGLVVSAGCGGKKLGRIIRGKEPYTIGAIFSTTGDTSSLGIPEKNTAQMLEKSINQAGGIDGHRLKIIFEDDAGDNSKCLVAAQKLIEKDKVLAIIGPTRTGTTSAIIHYVQSKQVPLISCAAGIEVVEPVAERKWIFKTPQSDLMAVERMIDYLKEHKIARVAVISDTTGFGKAGQRELRSLLPHNKIGVVGFLEYDKEDNDMTTQMTRVKSTNAEGVVCWGTPPGPAIVVRNMRELGMKIPFIAGPGIANRHFIDLAGKAAEGVVFVAGRLLVVDQIPDSDPQKPVLLEYTKNYQAAYTEPPVHFGGHAWSAVQLVRRALKKAGPDRGKIRDAIENTKHFVGVDGVFNFSPTDHNGLTKDAVVVIQIKDGKWKLLEE